MGTHLGKVPLTLSLMAGILGSGRAYGKVIDGGPQKLSQVSSIGESLRRAGQRPLHILYVHGIGATGAGGSWMFQQQICAFLKDCTVAKAPVPLEREYADSGEFKIGATPPGLEYLGHPVWNTMEEWQASAPFVDHYVLKRSDGGPIVVDEINWWPLVFSLKCRAIMRGEAQLAGPNKSLLDLCSQETAPDKNHPGRFTAYQWIDPQEAKNLESIRPKGALFNRWLKNNILDWGFADAIMAVGSLHDIFREGMRQLFVKSARFQADGSKTYQWQEQLSNPRGIDREFVVVSHSLGSYLVFSTLNGEQRDASSQGAANQDESGTATEDAAARYILERTSLVYFFANQVPLLESANMTESKASESAQAKAQPEAAGVLGGQLMKWKNLRQDFGMAPEGAEESARPLQRQVIAWSDPSDLLTWRVPAMDGLVVDNLYVRNTWWHWLIANPGAAHGDYAKNKNVLRVMLGARPPEAK